MAAPGARRRKFGLSQVWEFLLIFTPAVLLIAGAFWFAFQFVEPAPPTVVRISSGSEGGGYFGFAHRYAEILNRSGIELKVMPSAGSIENIERLGDDEAGVSLALLQGGVATSRKAAGQTMPDLMSIGRVFLEPLWIFYRSDEEIDALSQLKGKRLAIGAPGSGTRILVEALLQPNNMSADNTDLNMIGGSQAAAALKKGDVDAIFLALSPEAPLIAELLKTPGLRILNLRHAEAYTRLLPYLKRVVLPAGVIDLVAGIPASDVEMVAAQAALVARTDTHPAIVTLLVEAVREVHGDGGMFRSVGDFPINNDPEYSMSEDADRLYKYGPPFLQRFLPFWLATFIERMIVMIVPIATILIPLAKIVPWLYEWRIKRRIFYWFRELRDLERQLSDRSQTPDLAAMKAELVHIEDAVSSIPVPLHFSDRLYELRAAVDLVRQRVVNRDVDMRPVT